MCALSRFYLYMLANFFYATTNVIYDEFRIRTSV